MTNLPLHLISETTGTWTLGWTPIPCAGYVLYQDGIRKSNSWDPDKASWRTAKAQEIRIVAVDVTAEGVWPAASAPLLGGNLAVPFPEITGTPKVCATWADLSSALTAGGVIEIASMITVPAGVYNATIGKPATYIYGKAGAGITNGRFLVQADRCRIRNLEISHSLYDGVKIADNSANVRYVDLDNLHIHDVGDQGVLGGNGTSTDVWVRNCHIHDVGQTPNPGVQADGHCVYTGKATRWTIINNLLSAKAFGIQVYDSNGSPVDCVVAGNTLYHSDLRGLATVKGTGHRFVGNISVDGPGGVFEGNGSYEAWGTVWWMASSYTNGYPLPVGDGGLRAHPGLTPDWHPGDGSPAIGAVPQTQWGWLPAFDRDGRPRVTGDAGCYA